MKQFLIGLGTFVLTMANASAVVVNLSATAPAPSRTLLSVADPGMYTSFASLVGTSAANGLYVVSQDLFLSAGLYSVTATNPSLDGTALFNAANRFGPSVASGCQSGGVDCAQGWEHTYYVKLPSATGLKYGSGEGISPSGPAYFSTAATAFSNAVPSTFQLASSGTVKLYWVDDNWNDNAGGISLNVAAVPEPGEWAMMLAGLGVVGLIAKRRRQSPGR